QGRRFVMDLGADLNDDTLSRIGKAKAIGKALGSAGLSIGGGLLVATAIGRLFPKCGRLLGKLGRNPSLFLKTVMGQDFQDDLLTRIPRAFAGYQNPLKAIEQWQLLGIPEASYFKIDPKVDAQPLFGYRSSSDRNTLSSDSARGPTPRVKYWGR